MLDKCRRYDRQSNEQCVASHVIVPSTVVRSAVMSAPTAGMATAVDYGKTVTAG